LKFTLQVQTALEWGVSKQVIGVMTSSPND
jgi:hypothetical protein